MQHAAGNNNSGIRIRSVDGTAYRITSDSMTDYILHPVFLRFLALVIAIYALLDQRSDMQSLGGWTVILPWVAVACVVLGWLVLWSPLVQYLLRNGWITRLYTPVLLMPMILFTELAVQSVLVLLGAADWSTFGDTAQRMARDMVVVNLIDMVHGHYVVTAHPLACPETVSAPSQDPSSGRITPLPPPDEHPAPEPAADLAGEAPAPLPPAPARPSDRPDGGAMVQIGPAVLPLSSILLIRTEDHYVGVTTRTGKALHRAKMADIPELHSGIAGMQINRSVWIAYAAIKEVIDADNRQVVVSLITGDEERVSKPRIFAFRQSYAKYLSAKPA